MKVIRLPSVSISPDVLWQTPGLSFSVMSHVVNGTPGSEELSTTAIRHLAERDFLYTLGTMCAPDDPAQVERLFEALNLEDLYTANQILSEGPVWSSMSCSTASAIIHRPPVRDILDNLISKKWVAHIACGHILRRIVSMYQHNPRRASLTKAAAMVESFCKQNRISGGTKQNVIRYIWPRYKSVAHLWAAWSAIQESGLGEKQIWEWYPTFCGTSQWLLEQGAAIALGRSHNQTLLTLENSWVLPESRITRLPDGAIARRVWNEVLEAHDLRYKRMPTVA